MKIRLRPLLLILSLLAPTVVLADVCEDINYIANGWNEMANALHNTDLSQITEAEAAEVDAAITEAYGATEEFAILLETEGSADEIDLGSDLRYALVTLWNTQDGTLEDTVWAMDEVVDALDNITDYCDQQ